MAHRIGDRPDTPPADSHGGKPLLSPYHRLRPRSLLERGYICDCWKSMISWFWAIT